MSERQPPRPASAHRSGPLRGNVRVAGDRSIALRALILGALASGETRLSGLPDCEAVLRIVEAMRALGARVEGSGSEWTLSGVGNGCLLEPTHALDFGSSAEAAQLVMGLVGTYDMRVQINGDATLSRRPMGRVLDPLRLMGVQVQATAGDRVPLTLHGPKTASPVSYRVPLASAQVKSCILLAGLNAPGVTKVIESVHTADHTERLLRQFGANLQFETDAGGLRHMALRGQGPLIGQTISVPGDPSVALAAAVAAVIVPDSDVTIEGVLMNPTRTGLLITLREMGASIEIARRRVSGGEDVADLRVRASALKGVTVPAGRAPSMIDDYPLLAVAATFAEGETRMEGLEELRSTETDSLAALAAALQANGAECEDGRDWLLVRGATGVTPKVGGPIETAADPRIAMSMLVMGLAAGRPMDFDDVSAIEQEVPGALDVMRRLGAEIG